MFLTVFSLMLHYWCCCYCWWFSSGSLQEGKEMVFSCWRQGKLPSGENKSVVQFVKCADTYCESLANGWMHNHWCSSQHIRNSLLWDVITVSNALQADWRSSEILLQKALHFFWNPKRCLSVSVTPESTNSLISLWRHPIMLMWALIRQQFFLHGLSVAVNYSPAWLKCSLSCVAEKNFLHLCPNTQTMSNEVQCVLHLGQSVTGNLFRFRSASSSYQTTCKFHETFRMT